MFWRRLAQFGLMLVLLQVLGCKGMFGPQGLPPDPLFANRKPIESKAKVGPAQAIAFSEPLPPVNPYFADSSRTATVVHTKAE